MILEIALGIVLALIIVRFWPVIVGLGVILLVAAIALMAAGLLVVWALEDSAGFGVIATVVGATLLIAWVTRAKPVVERRRALGYDRGVGSLSDRETTDEERRRQDLGYGRGSDEAR